MTRGEAPNFCKFGYPICAILNREGYTVPGNPNGNALGIDESKPRAFFELPFNRFDFGHEAAGVAA